MFNYYFYRALRILKSADVILSEDTRHSSKLLHHYNIKTPLVSLSTPFLMFQIYNSLVELLKNSLEIQMLELTFAGQLP